MFSALKRFVTNDQGKDAKGSSAFLPSGLQSMGQSLQKKFSKGIQYNMKIILKGDRNTGKTTLFHRLQGQKFSEEYIPTQEIQVASIQWNYQAADDIVKVEIWDIVDKGKSKKKKEGLKLDNKPEEDEDGDPCLDAEFLDVYKGTHGVVILMDITKQWTFDYVQRELEKIPSHLPVLVLANFMDMKAHRNFQTDDVTFYLEHLDRPLGAGPIHYAESSMKNGFGLKYLHQFLNIPFLLLQRETLLRQLETNQKDLDRTLEDLSDHFHSDQQDYDKYVESLVVQKKPKKQEVSAANGGDDSSQKLAVPEASSSSVSPSGGRSPSHSVSSTSPVPTPTAAAAASQPSAQVSQTILHQKLDTVAATQPAKVPHAANQVEDFVPDDRLDRSFLEDGESRSKSAPAHSQPRRNTTEDSDSESDGGNPMVAGFMEDLDSEDERVVGSTPPLHPPGGELSSEDDAGGGGGGGEGGPGLQLVMAATPTSAADQVDSGPAASVSVVQSLPSDGEEDSGSSTSTNREGAGELVKREESQDSFASPPITLNANDFSFLESHTYSSATTPSVASTSTKDDDESSEETSSQPVNSGSTKKKKHKHKEKDRDRDKDGEKLHKRHKHKKHKDRDKDKEDKKKKHKKKEKRNPDMDDLETFLSGGDGGGGTAAPKLGADYELF